MLRAYVRLVVFALGLLAGVQIPGFVDQYAKRVSAHYIEASKSFAGFQHLADQYFGGNVDALIAHHASSADAVFHDEAKNIEAISARLKSLGAELAAMNRPLIIRIAHVAFSPDKDILKETIAAYSYTVPLNADAILYGLGAGLLLAALAESLLVGILTFGLFMIRGSSSSSSRTLDA
jgi:hypothetical protein